MGKVREPRIDYDGRDLVSSHGYHTPKRIVIHDTEGLDAPGIADLASLAEFFKRQGRGYGYHVAVDKDGLSSRMVEDKRIAWHVAGMNTDSLGISMIAQAWFPRATWLLRPKQLHKVARWMAYWSVIHEIPLRLAKHQFDAGVLTHRMASQFDGAGGSDHGDPGAFFPLLYVLFMARRYAKRGW